MFFWFGGFYLWFGWVGGLVLSVGGLGVVGVVVLVYSGVLLVS